jgi:hypothetical protein
LATSRLRYLALTLSLPLTLFFSKVYV